MFSLDGEILREGTLAAERLAALRKEAVEIVVFVPDGAGSRQSQFLRLWKSARRAFIEDKFDIVTVQDTAYLALLAYLVARRFHASLEVQVHGFEKLHCIRKMIAGFVLRRADKVRVVSQRLMQLAVDFGASAEKVYVLPVYTQTTSTPLAPLGVLPLRKGGEAEGNAFTFLTVGRLVPVKNIAMQIRALARIVREFPQARLRIVGSGILEWWLKSQVKSLKSENRVVFEGQQKDLALFYEEADAFLLTSDSEGWGVAVVEAAAYGLPIIMTDVGCAGEFIQNGENGIVIPIGGEGELAAAMERFIVDEPLRVRLGEAARASFFALPSPQAHIQKQAAEWRTLL